MNLPDNRREASHLYPRRAADLASGQGRRKEAGTPALYGRQKGKKLGIHHKALLKQLLPKLSIDLSRPLADPASLFGGTRGPLWLEIGFGGGEHLADEAGLFPQMNFIGCEAFLNGMAKALELIEIRGLNNVRLHQGDAQDVLDRLPPAALDGIYLLYPDPWPKRRQRKRRFISDEVLARLARVMRKGAELRFATDIDDYAGWTIARILRSNDFIWPAEGARDWQRPWPDWRGTRYEAKALAQGRRPVYLTFMRN
jgi:tRNA (guanine-N7-)-methyltransferase